MSDLVRDLVNEMNFPPNFHHTLDFQEKKGVAKYYKRLALDSNIDADQYAKEEAADLVMYLTLASKRCPAYKRVLYTQAVRLVWLIWLLLWGDE